jgi:hypothetical protein
MYFGQFVEGMSNKCDRSSGIHPNTALARSRPAWIERWIAGWLKSRVSSREAVGLYDLAFEILERSAAGGTVQDHPLRFGFLDQRIDADEVIHVAAEDLVQGNVQGAQSDLCNIRRRHREEGLVFRAEVDDHDSGDCGGSTDSDNFGQLRT